MPRTTSYLRFITFFIMPLILCSCATTQSSKPMAGNSGSNFSYRLPQNIKSTGEKVVVVNPRVHAWGAYGPDGNLIRGGLATSGSSWCADLGRSCRTKPGSYRIYSLGSPNCKSSIFPLPRGGAPMPFCMFFNGGQALHGSPYVVDGNVSHGCVRLPVQDAAWLRYNFATVGTRVIVNSY